MKIHKIKLSKRAKSIKTRDFTRLEAAFVVNMIRSTPVTPERLAIAEARASRARDAKSAAFLDKYRVKAAA